MRSLRRPFLVASKIDSFSVLSESHMAMNVTMQDNMMNISTQQMLFIIDMADG